MKNIKKLGPIYFILTYVLAFVWLYKGVSTKFQFCLSSHHLINILGIIAALFGLLTFYAYNGHEKGNVRALGIITLLFGLVVLAVVAYRFFDVTQTC
jgi:hypothetical protein